MKLLASLVLTLALGFATPGFAAEPVTLGRVMVDVFAKSDAGLAVEHKLSVDAETVALAEIPALASGEGRWRGKAVRAFSHDGMTFQLVLEVLKVQKGKAEPEYFLTTVIARPGQDDVAAASLEFLPRLAKQHRLRLDGAYMTGTSGTPFKIVAGLSY